MSNRRTQLDGPPALTELLASKRPPIYFCDTDGRVTADSREAAHRKGAEVLSQMLAPTAHTETGELLWSEAEWKQAIQAEGEFQVNWITRTLLLCRAQLNATIRKLDKPGWATSSFLCLPNYLVVSTKLFWPPGCGAQLKSYLTRLPEAVLFAALQELFAREWRAYTDSLSHDATAVFEGWNDERLPQEIGEWLREHGASDAWCSSGKKTGGPAIASFRARIRKYGLGDRLKTQTDRMKDYRA